MLAHGKVKNGKNTPIPSLQEVLSTIPSYGSLIIEIKCGLEIVPFLLEEIKDIPSHQIEFIAFDFEVVSILKQLAPEYKSLWLLDLDYTPETKKKMSFIGYLHKQSDNCQLRWIKHMGW